VCAGGIYKCLISSIVADLDHTDPTSSIRSEIFHIAYRRDVDAKLKGSLENGAPLLHIDPSSIYGEIDSFYFHRNLLLGHIMSFLGKQESSIFNLSWTPAFAGVTAR
jgi:hypothetical protein